MQMQETNMCESSHRAARKKWVHPHLVIYGDMTALTQTACRSMVDPVCKLKTLGMGDDFSSNISTLG